MVDFQTKNYIKQLLMKRNGTKMLGTHKQHKLDDIERLEFFLEGNTKVITEGHSKNTLFLSPDRISHAKKRIEEIKREIKYIDTLL